MYVTGTRADCTAKIARSSRGLCQSTSDFCNGVLFYVQKRKVMGGTHKPNKREQKMIDFVLEKWKNRSSKD
jgi:hypothetical protein